MFFIWDYKHDLPVERIYLMTTATKLIDYIQIKYNLFQHVLISYIDT